MTFKEWFLRWWNQRNSDDGTDGGPDPGGDGGTDDGTDGGDSGGDGGTDDGTDGGTSEPEPDYENSLSTPSTFEKTWKAHTISSTTTYTYGSDAALQTVVEAGTQTGGTGQIRTSTMVGYEPEEFHQRFYIRFGEDFNPNDNCKAPGFTGDYDRTLAGTTQPDGYNGWSARGAYNKTADGLVEPGFYVYHVDQPDWWGHHDWWNVTLDPGQWYQIDQYIQLNTPWENDGILRAWVDGEQVYERTNWRWRDTEDLKVESFAHDFFHGGDNTAPSTYTIYTDEYAAWADQGSPL